VPPQNGFHLRSPVIAVFQLHDFRRSAAGLGQAEEVGVGRYYREAVGGRMFPDLLIWRESGETGLKDVNRTGEEIREPMNELGRQICVKEELQRDLRARPDCEA